MGSLVLLRRMRLLSWLFYAFDGLVVICHFSLRVRRRVGVPVRQAARPSMTLYVCSLACLVSCWVFRVPCGWLAAGAAEAAVVHVFAAPWTNWR